ncbi:MAG: hypothetical protein LUE93_07940 [Bacteroides sp.]|nr:hypothetical protein [Bacteroides sp.]
MKQVYLLIGLVLMIGCMEKESSYSGPQEELIKELGVKSYEVKRYLYESGKPDKSKFLLAEACEFDKEGKTLKMIESTDHTYSAYEYSYNTDGKETGSKRYRKNNELMEYTETVYENNTESKSVYDADSTFKGKMVYYRDPYERDTLVLRYNKDLEVKGTQRYTYDGNGLAEHKVYNAEGVLVYEANIDVPNPHEKVKTQVSTYKSEDPVTITRKYDKQNRIVHVTNHTEEKATRYKYLKNGLIDSYAEYENGKPVRLFQYSYQYW